MQSLILHATAMAQWHALLHEAQQSSAIHLKEEVEHYLASLLMRFTQETEITSSILAMDFLKGHQQNAKLRAHALKDVGDKCLLFAGLFPGSALKRRVKLSYYVKLGQFAYATVSDHLHHHEALFIELCLTFPKLMDVLHATRKVPPAMDLFQALELWHETRSQTAWQYLSENTHGLHFSPYKNKNSH